MSILNEVQHWISKVEDPWRKRVVELEAKLASLRAESAEAEPWAGLEAVARAAVIEECLGYVTVDECRDHWSMTHQAGINKFLNYRKRRLTQNPKPVKTPEERVTIVEAETDGEGWYVLLDGTVDQDADHGFSRRGAEIFRLGLIAELTEAGKSKTPTGAPAK